MGRAAQEIVARGRSHDAWTVQVDEGLFMAICSVDICTTTAVFFLFRRRFLGPGWMRSLPIAPTTVALALILGKGLGWPPARSTRSRSP